MPPGSCPEWSLPAEESTPGEAVDLGQRVAIIGGGNTAMDAARSALRLGAKPLIIYRRTKEEMPAWEEEISEAEEEQIEFIFLSSPVKILTENGKVKGVECVKNILGPPGKDGRREPRPIENSNFTLPVDAVISAIGETPDFSFLPQELQKSKDSVPVDETGATGVKRVFAGGDIVAQPRTVSYAIGSGKKAAMAIDATLRGKNAAEALRRPAGEKREASPWPVTRSGGTDGMAQEVVPFSELNTAYFKRQSRESRRKNCPSAERTSTSPRSPSGSPRPRPSMKPNAASTAGCAISATTVSSTARTWPSPPGRTSRGMTSTMITARDAASAWRNVPAGPSPWR